MTTSTAHPSIGPAAPQACVVKGAVTDAFGDQVAGDHVVLVAGRHQEDVATDAGGFYETTDLAAPPVDVFDPAVDEAFVGLVLENRARAPGGYRILFGRGVVAVMLSDLFVPGPGEDCVRDFDLRSIPSSYRALVGNAPKALWADWVEIYELVGRARLLAETLEPFLDYGLLLEVAAGCECYGEVFYQGGLSDGRQVLDRLFIAIDMSASLLSDPGRPDDREYHEMGRDFLADAFGNAMPDDGRDVDHGGYYHNFSSTDAWTEGSPSSSPSW